MQSAAYTGASRNCTVPAHVMRTPPCDLIVSYPSSKYVFCVFLWMISCDLFTSCSGSRAALTSCSLPRFPLHWKHLLFAQYLVTNSSTMEAIHSGSWVQPGGICMATLGRLHSYYNQLPSSALSLMMAHAHSSNCSISIALMLVVALDSCFTRVRSPTMNAYTKVSSDNPPNKTASYLSACKEDIHRLTCH